ncbi:hypothetical protein FGO68_gene1066 [Halteria grandinella]|uniref:Uncharacterized protein n=1 Tax=Halteria grandinella TaxID=5974 RepID=A0A8J8P388_HALGN|nr:hypothetical protein FGO68_gene1066 [Halteria grandinella]
MKHQQQLSHVQNKYAVQAPIQLNLNDDLPSAPIKPPQPQHHALIPQDSQFANKDKPSGSLYTKIINRTQISQLQKQGDGLLSGMEPKRLHMRASTIQEGALQAYGLNKTMPTAFGGKGSPLSQTLQMPFQGNNSNLSNLLPQLSHKPVQIITKQLLPFPRSDSVRSNASAYPVLQGGGSKVVRLIRNGDSNNNSNMRGSEGSSLLKGCEVDHVRKIQTPQVFKGKQKVVKKSSILKGAKVPPGSATNALFKSAFSSNLMNSDYYTTNTGAFKGLSSSFTQKAPPLTSSTNPFFSTQQYPPLIKLSKQTSAPQNVKPYNNNSAVVTPFGIGGKAKQESPPFAKQIPDDELLQDDPRQSACFTHEEVVQAAPVFNLNSENKAFFDIDELALAQPATTQNKDQDEQMNFSFTEDEPKPAAQGISDSFGAMDQQPLDNNDDSFGGGFGDNTAMNDSFSRQDHAPMNLDDELANAVIPATPPFTPPQATPPLQEEQVLQKYGIQKITGAQLKQQTRHQTNVSMRSCTSGVSSNAGGAARDQAPDKRKRNQGRHEPEQEHSRVFPYQQPKPGFADAVLSHSSRGPSLSTAFEPYKQQHFGSTMPAVFNTARKTSAPIMGGVEEFKNTFNPFKTAQKQPPVKIYGGDSPVRPRTMSSASNTPKNTQEGTSPKYLPANHGVSPKGLGAFNAAPFSGLAELGVVRSQTQVTNSAFGQQLLTPVQSVPLSQRKLTAEEFLP